MPWSKTGNRTRVPSVLPDPDDEHVVAAAVVGGAGAIVTENLKDFLSVKIPPHIKVLSPSQFAVDTVSVAPDLARRALQAMVNRFSPYLH